MQEGDDGESIVVVLEGAEGKVIVIPEQGARLRNTSLDSQDNLLTSKGSFI